VSHDRRFQELLERIQDTKETVQDEDVPLEAGQEAVAGTIAAIDAFEDGLDDTREDGP